MIFLYVKKIDSGYSVRVDEYDVTMHEVPPDLGGNVKCLYSHDRYEILGEVMGRVESMNGGSLVSDDLGRLTAYLDAAYVHTLFKHRQREMSRKAEAFKRGRPIFSAQS